MAEITTYKGFNKDWTCRDYQFRVGESYVHKGEVKACVSGFHSCIYPLDVLTYYNPCSSKYAVTTSFGKLSLESMDSKVASQNLKINEEITLHELSLKAVEYVLKNLDNSLVAATNTGDHSAATNTGLNGVAGSFGFLGKVSGTRGNALFLVERDRGGGNILNAWAGVVGKNKIKENVFYTLTNGEPVEVKY
jgi:hypothetical protein